MPIIRIPQKGGMSLSPIQGVDGFPIVSMAHLQV